MRQRIDNLICWSCHGSLDEVPQPISRHDYCPACSEVLHCCRLCALYDPDAVDGCREDRTEPPTNKSEANFCDYFEPVPLQPTPLQPTAARGSEQKLAQLFGDDIATGDAERDEVEGSSDPMDTARAALDALFKNKD